MSRHHTVAKRKTEKESSFVWRAHSKRSWRTGGTVDGDGAGDEASEPSLTGVKSSGRRISMDDSKQQKVESKKNFASSVNQ